MSARALRMERHRKRTRQGAGLNLVSLMDIFTILVFFLLVNSGDVEILPASKAVQLPESAAEQKPRQTLVIMVTAHDIQWQGKPIAELSAVLADPSDNIASLQTELERQAGSVVTVDHKPNAEITIMADRALPYRLLKKVMFTCTQAHFEHISLAVARKTDQEG